MNKLQISLKQGRNLKQHKSTKDLENVRFFDWFLIFINFSQILSSIIAPFVEIILWICASNVKQIKRQQQAKNVPLLGVFAM